MPLFYFPPYALRLYRLRRLPAGPPLRCILFFFTLPATPQIYTLSLHDALPISPAGNVIAYAVVWAKSFHKFLQCSRDRKSTRLNSSHVAISYAVFCLKKKSIQRGRIHTAYRLLLYEVDVD